MRTPELSFEGIGTDPLNCLSRLADAKLFAIKDGYNILAEDIGGLIVTFQGIQPEDGLSIEDVATLALVVRAVAEAGKTVEIMFPRLYQGRPSRIHRFLERLGFRSLFTGTLAKEAWMANVHISQSLERISSLTPRKYLTNYIPLRWFGNGDFEYDRSVSIWRAHPILKPTVDRQLRAVIQAHGFADLETIDLLTKTIFLEIGWNTVLHSCKIPGTGSGVFCGQIGDLIDPTKKTRQPEVTLCIADLGRGIPEALRGVYNTNAEWHNYHEREQISQNSAIVRYALDPTSTSRPELPSDYDKAGFRGLALVASALEGRGEMLIRSGGGAVRLIGKPGGTKALPNDTFREISTGGTQIIGRIRKRAAPPVKGALEGNRVELPPASFNLVCDLNGNCSALSDANAARNFAASASVSQQVVIFDLGYADKSTRSLEYLCKSVISLYPDKWLIFWNISTPWTQLAALHDWITAQSATSTLPPPLFVRAHGDARCFGQTKTLRHAWLKQLLQRKQPKNSTEPTGPGQPLWLTTEEFLAWTFHINSSYLGRGFEVAVHPDGQLGSTECGFFSGRIHLLRGGAPASRYFSLTTNLNVAPDVNLYRWSESSAAAAVRLLERTPVDDAKLVLLGFTGTMREVLARVFVRLQRQCRAYVLLTFDIPSKEEIASKIHPGDHVLLLTDVISTGTLLDSVSSLVRAVGGKVIGVTSLVDARGVVDGVESTIHLGFEKRPLVTCGKLHTLDRHQGQLADAEYWVDPVSLVPSRKKAWGWSAKVDAKIEKTLSLIVAAKAALCGHIVDGARHTSVYVNLQRLLIEQDLPLQDQINAICDERLAQRGWNDFTPSVVLYPSGISRIESVSSPELSHAETVTVYRTAVKTYVERLRRKWKHMVPAEVQRAFDPGGGSRCASTIDQPTSIEGNIHDIVVADDGVWRGTTVNALMQIARAMGAERILIVPLLARISPSTAERFELIHSVQGPDDAHAVQVCYAFPLLLPIPYYGSHECPYEITIKRIQDRRTNLRSLVSVADKLTSHLAGRTPGDSPDSVEFCDSWLRLRAYVELASEHEGILEAVNKLIESIDSPDAMLAMFSMFSEEWRLLGRARLRQTIRATLRTRAEIVALSQEVRSDVRVAAFTVLRSHFCESFVDHLSRISSTAVEDPRLLGRLLLNIATLNEPWRRHKECLHFLEEIGDKAATSAARHKDEWQVETLRDYFELVTVGKSLALEFRATAVKGPQTKRAAAVHLFRFLMDDRILRHRVRPFIEILAGSSESIHDLDASNFKSFALEWKGQHEPLFIDEILPCLNLLHDQLLRTGTQGRNIISNDLRFLEGGVETVRGALSSLSAGLQFLQELPSVVVLKTAVVQAASQLMKDITDNKSTTMRLLNEMRRVTIGDMLKEFTAEIQAHFAALKLDIDVASDGTSDVNLSAIIYAPAEVIRLCTGNILDNLMRYAFRRNGARMGTERPRVLLCLTPGRSDSNEPMLTLTIKNSGSELKDGAVMGDGGRRAATALELFGGDFSLPTREAEVPWRVAHRIAFLLW